MKKKIFNQLPEDATPIPSYPTYYATPNGEIWRIAPERKTTFGIVKSRIIKIKDRYNSKNGYYQVQPFINGKKVLRYTHRLVLAAFKGECPNNCECDHIDRNTHNNHIDNLRWVTKKDNINNRGVIIRPINYNSKMKKHINEIQNLKQQGYSDYKIAKQFNVTQCTIWKINKNIDKKIIKKENTERKINLAIEYAKKFKLQGGTKSQLAKDSFTNYKILLKNNLLKEIF